MGRDAAILATLVASSGLPNLTVVVNQEGAAVAPSLPVLSNLAAFLASFFCADVSDFFLAIKFMKLAAFLLGDIAEMLALVTAAWTLGAPASFPQLSKTLLYKYKIANLRASLLTIYYLK